MHLPEHKLWRAVLEQAYEDAEMWADCPASVPSPGERLKARRYLRADSAHERSGLETVCEYADVPADRVILWARRRYKFAA
jgi:hypothetical protein